MQHTVENTAASDRMRAIIKTKLSRSAAIAALALLAGCATAAEQQGYDSSWELRVSGAPTDVTWSAPSSTLKLDMAGENWKVVLRSPGELEKIGLTRPVFEKANVIAIQGYAHESRQLEIRANTVTVDGVTTTLK
ncbi:MAG: hypothetical protein AAF220_10545 [Pseudomonadota bacterium]